MTTIGERLVKLLGETDARKVKDIFDSLDKLTEAAIPAYKELRRFLDESGGCDHQVGICWCSYIRMLDAFSEAISNAEKARKS